MKVALITGSSGLIGSEAVRFYSQKGWKVIGIDNDMRQYFFGKEGSTQWVEKTLTKEYRNFSHHPLDIRDKTKIEKIYKKYSSDIALVIHTAAQPSHDWAAREPQTDFTINANGTLNLLELTRQYCPKAVFINMSTNKVYGDTPNTLPLKEYKLRYDLPKNHLYFHGIDEQMSVDQSKHSLFGVSKLSGDLMTQEYGRYFGMKTVCFRGGCLTGPQHSGAQLHGFLSYLMKCCMTGEEYTIFGYKGKQVRDNIHSFDLITAFDCFVKHPKVGAVYNIGGGRENSCSVLEAIEICEEISAKKCRFKISSKNRIGDHIWYISNLKKFQNDYPQWRQKHTLRGTLKQIFELNIERWRT